VEAAQEDERQEAGEGRPDDGHDASGDGRPERDDADAEAGPEHFDSETRRHGSEVQWADEDTGLVPEAHETEEERKRRGEDDHETSGEQEHPRPSDPAAVERGECRAGIDGDAGRGDDHEDERSEPRDEVFEAKLVGASSDFGGGAMILTAPELCLSGLGRSWVRIGMPNPRTR
jgi:hypothetical protein